MKIHGPKLAEGGSIGNLTIPSGVAFPAKANNAELFFLTSGDVGLYMHDGTAWHRIGTYEETKDRHIVALLNASSSVIDHMVPDPVPLQGFRYTVKRIDSGQGFLCTVTASGETTIDGTPSMQLYPFESLTLFSDGTNWHII